MSSENIMRFELNDSEVGNNSVQGNDSSEDHGKSSMTSGHAKSGEQNYKRLGKIKR